VVVSHLLTAANDFTFPTPPRCLYCLFRWRFLEASPFTYLSFSSLLFAFYVELQQVIEHLIARSSTSKLVKLNRRRLTSATLHKSPSETLRSEAWCMQWK
jgi:hypothetical protein